MTVHQLGGIWGNHLRFWGKLDDGRWKFYGHRPLNRWPKVGDEIHVPMQSGRTAVAVVTEVKGEMDPDDMFWVIAEPARYVDDSMNHG